jgi:ASC-1-like (ASCH) protein
MRLSNVPFNKIIQGKKIIESRLFDKKRKKINLGDKIEFVCTEKENQKLVVKVVGLLIYPSFKKLMKDFEPKYFGNNSFEDNVDEIYKFYSEKDEKKYSVLGIKFERID